MEENFKIDDFEFTPPEFDMGSVGESVDMDTSFTAPSVENTLDEEGPVEAPVFETVEEKNEIEQEVSSEPNQTETIDIQPVKEEVLEDFPQFESPEVSDFEIPNFEAPTFEVTDEFEAPTDMENSVTEETVEDLSFEMPTEKETVPDTLQSEAQDKIANAIREKMAEMQEDSQDTSSYNMTENNDEISSFEPEKEEEIETSLSSESIKKESVSKEEIFAKGTENLRNLMKNESLKNANLMKNEAEL
ncbi:MAG: hypothetical protein ACI4N3_03330 [Alphaproteobacteria bacterium]